MGATVRQGGILAGSLRPTLATRVCWGEDIALSSSVPASMLLAARRTAAGHRDPQRVLFYELALRLVLDGRDLGEARIPIRVRNGDAQHRIPVGSWIPARVDPAMPRHAIADLSSLGVELH